MSFKFYLGGPDLVRLVLEHMPPVAHLGVAAEHARKKCLLNRSCEHHPSSPGLAACSPRTGVSSNFLQAGLKSYLHGDIQQEAIVSWLMVATV